MTGSKVIPDFEFTTSSTLCFHHAVCELRRMRSTSERRLTGSRFCPAKYNCGYPWRSSFVIRFQYCPQNRSKST